MRKAKNPFFFVYQNKFFLSRNVNLHEFLLKSIVRLRGEQKNIKGRWGYGVFKKRKRKFFVNVSNIKFFNRKLNLFFVCVYFFFFPPSETQSFGSLRWRKNGNGLVFLFFSYISDRDKGNVSTWWNLYEHFARYFAVNSFFLFIRVETLSGTKFYTEFLNPVKYE